MQCRELLVSLVASLELVSYLLLLDLLDSAYIQRSEKVCRDNR